MGAERGGAAPPAETDAPPGTVRLESGEATDLPRGRVTPDGRVTPKAAEVAQAGRAAPEPLSSPPAPKVEILSSKTAGTEAGERRKGDGASASTETLTSREASSMPQAPVTPVSAKAEGAGAAGEPPEKNREDGIKVLNGNGKRGSASGWAKRFRAGGIAVARIGDAGRMDYPKTIIYYRLGAENLAVSVRRVLGRRGSLRPEKSPGPHPVVVILGLDAIR